MAIARWGVWWAASPQKLLRQLWIAISAAALLALIQAALHIGGPGAERIAVAAAHQRLGRQVQHHLRLAFASDRIQGLRVADVHQMVRLQPLLHPQLLKQVGVAVRRQAHAAHLRAHLAQPQRQPAALEAGVAGEQHPLARPEPGGDACVGHQFHTFQGARPAAQSSSSFWRSRKVSIGCQKPW